MVTRAAGAVFGVALLAAPGLAQSVDPVFTSGWTWTPETLSAEATGLGGAYVATVRGAEALYSSPAAMTFDRGLDVRASVGARPGLGVVHHGEKLHIGVGIRRTFSRVQYGGPVDAASDVFEVGHLGVMIDQAALGVAMRAGRLRFGGTLAAGPMRAIGDWSRVVADAGGTGVTETRYDYKDVNEWQIGGSASALFEMLQTHPMARTQARFGAAVHWPTMLRTPRYRRNRLVLRLRETGPPTAGSPAVFEPFDATGPDLQSFRLPLTVSFGGEARLAVLSMFRSVRIAAGADWTDYEGILDTARANGAEAGMPLGFDSDRPWTFGGGVELVHQLLRVRVGMRERTGHRLVTPAPPPARQTRARTTFGASRDAVVAGKRIQVDVDSTSSFDDLVLAVRLLW